MSKEPLKYMININGKKIKSSFQVEERNITWQDRLFLEIVGPFGVTLSFPLHSIGAPHGVYFGKEMGFITMLHAR